MLCTYIYNCYILLIIWSLYYYIMTFFVSCGSFFILFRAAPVAGTWGSNQSCRYWPTPQPRKCQIQVTCMTYATACSNAGSLIHWVRQGSKCHPQGQYAGFLTWWATIGTPLIVFLFLLKIYFACYEYSYPWSLGFHLHGIFFLP